MINADGSASPTTPFEVTSAGRLRASRVTLRQLIQRAYGTPRSPLRDFQVVGGPDWTTTDFCQVDATAPDDALAEAPQQALLMLRTLLAERSGLRLRTESRELPASVLTVASADGRLGPRLTRSPDLDCDKVEDEARQRAAAGQPSTDAPAAAAAQARCAPSVAFNRGEMSVAMKGTSMARFVSALNDAIGRLIIDRTGLVGAFDVAFTLAASEIAGLSGVVPQRPDDVSAPLEHTLRSNSVSSSKTGGRRSRST